MLVLKLSEMLKVYSSRIEDLLALRVNKYYFFVLLKFLATLDIFLAVFFAHVYCLDLGFRLLYLFHH